MIKNKSNIENNITINNFIIWRFNFLLIFIIILLFILIARVTYLQLIHTKKLIQKGDVYSIRMHNTFNIRGIISDRFGYVLAMNIPVYNIWINPKEANYCDDIKIKNKWKTLAYALGISLDEILMRISTHSTGYFIYLARQVDSKTRDCILNLKLPGVYSYQELRRYYPAKQITSHVIGITDIDNKGIEGIEKSFDYYLTGQIGKRTVRKDRLGRVIEDIALVKNHHAAKNLVLSIDIRLQELIYNEINKAVILNQAESGTAVLVNVHTGEVLSMVNSPSYDPNNLLHLKKDVMRNKAITDVFEPGSIIKPIIILTALKEKIIQENSILNTASYFIQGHQIKDVVQYDKLTVKEIIQKSSNVGISKIALLMPSSVLLNTYSRCGFGKKTNLGLIGESNGIFNLKRKKWSKIEQATFSYGYGFMTTVSQLVRLYAAIGSMGILRPLTIIKTDNIISGERIFPEILTRKVINMMESVSLPGGSGVKACIKGYRVAIKTGTVKKINFKGQYINKYVSYVAGIAPASNPQFALVISIDNPQNGKYYGGTVAAPVFSKIMGNVLRIMNIQPDAF